MYVDIQFSIPQKKRPSALLGLKSNREVKFYRSVSPTV